MGAAVSLEAEDNYTATGQSAASGDGNGQVINVGGYSGAITIEIVNAAGGTANIYIEGSIDGTRWYALGYQQIDGVSSLSRTTAAIAVGAGPGWQHLYALLDAVNYLRTRQQGSSSSPAPSITTNISCNPV
jgi:hypothetical protein